MREIDVLHEACRTVAAETLRYASRELIQTLLRQRREMRDGNPRAAAERALDLSEANLALARCEIVRNRIAEAPDGAAALKVIGDYSPTSADTILRRYQQCFSEE